VVDVHRDVGKVEMLLNGKAVSENFLSAPLLHNDVILGEPWMRENSIVMDYSHNVLWQWSHGVLKPVTFDVPLRSDPQAITPDLQAQAHFNAQATRAAMVASAVTTGLRHATISPADRQSEIMHEDMERDRIRAIQTTPLDQRLLGQEDYMPPDTAAHTRHQEARHFQNCTFLRTTGLHMLGDVSKELPEDGEFEGLVDMEIPGLVPPVARAFDFVEAEVRAQLGDLSKQKQADIIRLLESYEPTVFETRDMPQLAPHRQWDLDIMEVEGARPVAGRPYPVAPQHLPELNRQIAVLEEAGIIRRSRNLYGALALFAPKKDGRLRLYIDYRKLNCHTLRDCYPTPVATDLIARTRGARMFSQLDLRSGFHQLRIREGDQHKTAFVTPGGQYEWVTCPFGLSNTPSYFQRLMNDILHDHIAAGYCVCYCDDLLICTESDDPAEHLLKLTAGLDTLHEHDLLGQNCFAKRSNFWDSKSQQQAGRLRNARELHWLNDQHQKSSNTRVWEHSFDSLSYFCFH